jgi:hypothetical protein
MKVFLLGATRSGKTPIAEHISICTGYRLISAGAWATVGSSDRDRTMEEHVRCATLFSVQSLKTNFRRSLEFAQLSIEGFPDVVIDGERNPFDFIHLFNPREDAAISIRIGENVRFWTDYEEGLLTIWKYLDWLLACGFIVAQQHRSYQVSCLYTDQRRSENCVALDAQIVRIASVFMEDRSFIHGQ